MESFSFLLVTLLFASGSFLTVEKGDVEHLFYLLKYMACNKQTDFLTATLKRFFIDIDGSI